MPANGATILKHPDKDKIVQMLSEGMSVKKVESWLKTKYPEDKTFRISWITLQAFRTNFLKLHGEALDQAKLYNRQKASVERSGQQLEEVKNLPAYKGAVKNLTKNYIDLQERLLDLDKVIWLRIKDHIETVKGGDNTIKDDKQLSGWVSNARLLLQDYAKLVEQRPDSIHQHNVDVHVVHDYADVVKEVIREVLVEIDPEKIPVFLEKCNERLNKLKLPNHEQQAKNILKSLPATDAEYSEVIEDSND